MHRLFVIKTMKSMRDGARTDSMISMLMTYTVNTCAIVA